MKRRILAALAAFTLSHLGACAEFEYAAAAWGGCVVGLEVGGGKDNCMSGAAAAALLKASGARM